MRVPRTDSTPADAPQGLYWHHIDVPQVLPGWYRGPLLLVIWYLRLSVWVCHWNPRRWVSCKLSVMRHQQPLTNLLLITKMSSGWRSWRESCAVHTLTYRWLNVPLELRKPSGVKQLLVCQLLIRSKFQRLNLSRKMCSPFVNVIVMTPFRFQHN